jgi:hypothetical protein
VHVKIRIHYEKSWMKHIRNNWYCTWSTNCFACCFCTCVEEKLQKAWSYSKGCCRYKCSITVGTSLTGTSVSNKDDDKALTINDILKSTNNFDQALDHWLWWLWSSVQGNTAKWSKNHHQNTMWFRPDGGEFKAKVETLSQAKQPNLQKGLWTAFKQRYNILQQKLFNIIDY